MNRVFFIIILQLLVFEVFSQSVLKVDGKKIVNESGQKVIKAASIQKHSIHFSPYPDGIYFLYIYSDDSQKIVKIILNK